MRYIIEDGKWFTNVFEGVPFIEPDGGMFKNTDKRFSCRAYRNISCIENENPKTITNSFVYATIELKRRKPGDVFFIERENDIKVTHHYDSLEEFMSDHIDLFL